MDFDEWIEVGIQNGWCGPAVCYTHDGLPTSALEDEEWEDTDPCIHIVRMYESSGHKLEVEQNHSPSIWRQLGSR